MSSLRERLRREQFAPGWLGLFVNPFYFARHGLWHEMLPLFSHLTGDVLDVGCGRKPYREFVPAGNYVGMEIDTPEMREIGAADIYYSAGTFPLADGSFDAALCSQVLEHVFSPAEFLLEIRRVLRPGGVLLLTTPFAWDEHSQPYDFGRYSSFGLNHVLVSAGFEIVAQRKTCADGRALVQLTTGYLFKVLRSRNRWINRLVQLFVIAPVTVVGAALACLLPANPDFFLDNVVLARKPGTIGNTGGATGAARGEP